MKAIIEVFDSIVASELRRCREARAVDVRLRLAVVAASSLITFCGEGWAQTAPPESGQSRGGLIIGGKPAQGTVQQRCVEVEVGSERSFGCLNESLRREVDRVNPSLNLPPIDARSPDTRVGNANEAAIRLQYGSNYGRSAIPFRPASPSYLAPRR